MVCDNERTSGWMTMATTPQQKPDETQEDEYYVPEPRMVTREEGHAIFDQAARHYLGISGEEFLRRWDAGEFGDIDETPGLVEVYMMMSFGR